MQEIQRKGDRTSTDYELTNPYASGYNVIAFEIPQSTSADGWKYHKRNKRKKYDKRRRNKASSRK